MNNNSNDFGYDGHSNFLQTLLNSRDELPKKQKELCDYMIEHYQSVGLLTIAELAEAANVGTTTVMRLIKNLGYESYADVKKDILDASVQTTSSAWWHLKESFKHQNEGKHTLVSVKDEVVNLLDQTVTPSLLANFDAAIDLILKSEKVHILGARSTKSLAQYFGHLLELFYDNSYQLSLDTDFVFDRISRFTKGDILVLIDNAPFTTLGTDAAKYCHEKGHDVILITDHLSCPVSTFATVSLNTKSSNSQYSVVPTLFLIESLIIELGRKTANKAMQKLVNLDEILEKKNITQTFSFE